MKINMKNWIRLILRSAKVAGLSCVILLVSTCGGGGGGSDNTETCPGAQDLYNYAESLHEEAQQKVRFGSSWEVTYKMDVSQPIQLYRYPPSQEDEVNGAVDYHGTTSFSFTVPAAPDPVSCSEIQNLQSQFGTEDNQALRGIIAGLYEYRVNEQLGSLITSPKRITSTGTGKHASREDTSFQTNRFIDYFTCVIDNPCGQDRFATAGCNTSGIAHSVDAEIHIIWTVANDPILTTYINDFSPQGTTQTQSTINGLYHFNLVNYTPPCGGVFAVCDGTDTAQMSCGMGFQDFDVTGAPDILVKGTVQHFARTNLSGETRERTVELKCTSGCECVNAGNCDDGKECTRDECNAGNCENTPDDSIKPEQVSDDCRTCENGEVRSARKIAKQECETIKSDAIKVCSQSPNWLVHWTAQFGSQTEDAHYCNAGIVPGDSQLTICNGQGACSVGTPVTTNQGSSDMSCQNYNGQFVQLICDVLCTQCQ